MRQEEINEPPGADQLSVYLFDGGIPALLEQEIDRLYGHLYSSSAMFKACGVAGRASVYAARAGERYAAIFAFVRRGRSIEVLNEQILCSQQDIRLFSAYIFNKYPAVHSVRFRAIRTDGQCFGFPFQRTPLTNDVVLRLPETTDDYLAAMGNSTRTNIRRYLKTLQRDFPLHRQEIIEGSKASESLIRQIIALSHERMNDKRKDSGISKEEERRLFALVRECGIVTTITIDDRVCAGTILYRIDGNYFLRIVAHDPAYNRYRLGLLACYRSICECIARGGRNYHFLWGREPYKYRLMGTHRDLDLLTLYRSRLHVALDGASIARNATAATIRNAKWQLLEAERNNKPIGKIARKVADIAKGGPLTALRLPHSIFGPRQRPSATQVQ